MVATLRLDDAAKTTRVRDLIARQYAALRPIHQLRDEGLKLAKTIADPKGPRRAAPTCSPRPTPNSPPSMRTTSPPSRPSSRPRRSTRSRTA
ncbi:DUF3826 domain-containing protein [Oleiharenicola sp. Vm1]|uniref:DUF3826 domain-containing protein n=1 Tax=Oleiharenicola sp. Vm1 TaxID=3398393 RepID=UPI0039F47A0D